MVLDGTEPTDFSEDDRRRHAVEAGHAGRAETARDLLLDPAPRVRSAALGALARMGDLAVTELATGLVDPQPAVRRRAAELAAATMAPPLLALLDDADPTVVEMTAWALGERPLDALDQAELDALERVARGHDDPLCREAAVAALGALGVDAALPTVLAALDDKPAVRRRAVIALAAFEGPEVTAALQRALTDRDWQVRQAAEDQLRLDDTLTDDHTTDDQTTDDQTTDDDISG